MYVHVSINLHFLVVVMIIVLVWVEDVSRARSGSQNEW